MLDTALFVFPASHVLATSALQLFAGGAFVFVVLRAVYVLGVTLKSYGVGLGQGERYHDPEEGSTDVDPEWQKIGSCKPW